LDHILKEEVHSMAIQKGSLFKAAVQKLKGPVGVLVAVISFVSAVVGLWALASDDSRERDAAQSEQIGGLGRKVDALKQDGLKREDLEEVLSEYAIAQGQIQREIQDIEEGQSKIIGRRSGASQPPSATDLEAERARLADLDRQAAEARKDRDLLAGIMSDLQQKVAEGGDPAARAKVEELRETDEGLKRRLDEISVQRDLVEKELQRRSGGGADGNQGL
jgi:type II secretory pathway pseudopilin PulG